MTIRSCKLCEQYRREEIGDSDYGAIYAKTPSCAEYHDLDENDKEIEGFDRDIERECCALDFFKVCEIDTELSELIGKEDSDSMNYLDKALARFKEKYDK